MVSKNAKTPAVSETRTFGRARTNHTTPIKATSPSVTQRGVRHSPQTTSHSSPRGTAPTSRGIHSAPRDARSL